MTEPSYPRLHEAFRDLADEAAPADLVQRALHTSRRLSLRRAAVTTVVVAVLVGGGTATAAQILPVAGSRFAPGIGATDTTQSCPLGGAPVDPGPSPYSGPKEVVPAPNTGPLFYLQALPASNRTTVQLVSWTPGQAGTVVRRELPAPDASLSANVSPDGRWVSWVTLADGALHVAALTGDKAERVLRGDVDGRLFEPVWARDSARLLIRDTSTGKVGTVDVAHGGFAPLRVNLAGARHAVWASDGSAIAFITADGAVMVARPDGSGQQRVPATRFAREGRKVVSLQSMSGTSVGYGMISLYLTSPGKNPDGCRSLTSNAELYTGGLPAQHEGQSLAEYTLFQSAYRGKMFSHVSRRLDNQRDVALIGDNGEFWGGADEPAQLKDYLLLNT